MIVGEVDSAQVVTPKTIFVTKKDGRVITKRVWESLDEPAAATLPTVGFSSELSGMDYEQADIPSPQAGSTTNRVSILLY